MTASDCRSLFSFPSPLCHPERSACPESFEGKDLVVILCSWGPCSLRAWAIRSRVASRRSKPGTCVSHAPAAPSPLQKRGPLPCSGGIRHSCFSPICHPERSACPESFEGKDLVVILCSCRGRISCGPRSFLPWAPMGLDPFAETKEPVLSRAKEPRRAGTKPRILHVPFLSSSTIVIENPVSVALRTKEKEKALDPRSGSGMTDKRRKTAREGADVGQKVRTEVRRPAGRPVVTTA